MTDKTIINGPQLVVALDMPSTERALALAGQTLPATPWVKVGLELFTAVGPQVLHELKAAGCKIFLDLKFHDIPNTVYSAVKSALALGVDMCNIHMSGGVRMAEAAVQAVREGRAQGGLNCILLGVTVLTSTGQDEVRQDLGKLVLERAQAAHKAGLDGVVCSGHEAAPIKQHCGNSFICLCPGIRPQEAGLGAAREDQRRVMTPPEAVRAGADFLVVGRPITCAPDPAEAALRIHASMFNI